MWLVLSAEKKALAQGVVGSDVVSHWLKKWREVLKPIPHRMIILGIKYCKPSSIPSEPGLFQSRA